ncbi:MULTISPECIES: ABC transporter permease [Ornithinibacillus]|uniref:Transport permease protein n=2 Tax=Ornithinibacillus TaxID=484508 RepID=A0A923RFY2_9BACI|nr:MULTISPECIES: ABC transporter permease [Ornithinibacillus]MBC5635691.1 ABC transporter permease [Ornithinibacillus hominis]MBS3679302.1 ABC transporter permease [Ornithinibacillus massiliensis]
MKSYLQELAKRKDLLFYLVKSGLKAEHRNSYLGYFWWLLDPLLNVLVYYFVVVIILERGGPDYPTFLVIGLVVWRWISSSINASARSVLRYRSIINQVYLPKSIFPVAFSLTQLFNFAFGLVVIALFLVFFGYIPGWEIIYLPVLILITLAFLLAIGLFLGYFTVFIRDIDNLLTYVTRIFFYASPIIWVGSRLPENYSWAVDYNPIAIIIESYRDILMRNTSPDFIGLGIIFFVSIIVIIFMLYYFSKNEHKIIKAL